MKRIISILLVLVTLFSIMPSFIFSVASTSDDRNINIGYANYYTGADASQVIAWASADATKTVETMYNSSADASAVTFQWWYKALLEINEDGLYEVVQTTGMTADYTAWTLGEGRIVLLCHDTAGANFTAFSALTVGDTLALSCNFTEIADKYTALSGVTLTSAVAEQPSPKFDLVIEGPAAYKAGDEIEVTIKVKNITATNGTDTGLTLVDFKLYYDETKLLITNDLNKDDENSLMCVTTVPASNWDNLSSVNYVFDEDQYLATPVNDGLVNLRVATINTNKRNFAVNDDSIVFTLTFTVLEGATDDILVYIPHESVLGATNSTNDLFECFGNGDSLTIKDGLNNNENDFSEETSNSSGEANPTEEELEQQIIAMFADAEFEDVEVEGPKVEALGYEFPLFSLKAGWKLSIWEGFGKRDIVHIDFSGNKVKVVIGVKPRNIEDAKDEEYWTKTYREIKSLYQGITGDKIHGNRLWNNFEKMHSDLDKINTKLVVDTTCSMAVYMEFDYTDFELKLLDGGMLASFAASTKTKTPIAAVPGAYMAFGMTVGADSTIGFVIKEKKILPAVEISPSVQISGGLGWGTKKTYVQGDVYGKIKAKISILNEEDPFRLGVECGVKFAGYFLGKKVFSASYAFDDVEIFPNFGQEWSMARFALTPNMDASDLDCYRDLINSGTPIDRSYLASAYSLRRSTGSLIGAEFVKNNAYPLSEPSLVSFDNGNMLLVWVDDNGTKTQENMCTIMYSYFDGSEWSTPEAVYEDGTNNDMPSVYSDGTYAYIVWQKATKVFEEGIETTEMLENFDLYATVFDSTSRTFGDVIAINPEDDTNFEMNAIVRGENGSFTVAWLENSDNNIYQLSDSNSLYTATVDANGNLVSTVSIIETACMFNDIELTEHDVLYSLFETDKTNLYRYNGETTLLFEAINSFEEENGLIYYTTADGFYTYNGLESIKDDSMSSLDDFVIKSNGNDIVIFATVLNEDFTKSLYYSEYSFETSEWGDFELYSNEGRYIRNYSPVVLADGTSLVAFNYVTEFEDGTESASIVVGKCTDETDVQVTYVDFDEEQLDSGNVDFQIGVKNFSSALIESFNISISDNTGAVVHSETVSKTLAPFGEEELSVNFTIPEGYTNELYMFTVLPEGYSDYNEENNTRQTTFERILRPADYTAYLEALGLTENLVETDYTTKSWKTLSEAVAIDVAERLDIEQDEVDDATEAIVNAFESLSKGILGDVDENGEIDSTDYIFVKRFVQYTYEFETIPGLRADINGDGEIAIIDYLMLKRHTMGTYIIGD